MKNEKKQLKNRMVIYQAKSGAIALRADYSRETLWATQPEIAELFDIHRTVVLRHIKNIANDREVDVKSNVQKMHIANSDKPITLYSLDFILAVGYRANSGRAIQFRQWATKTLREYVTKGYALDKRLVARNLEGFLASVEDIKKLAGNALRSDDAFELVKAFADTWLSLTAYDKGDLPRGGTTKRTVALTADKLAKALAVFKADLMKQDNATELFGQERQTDAVAGIVGNVMQAFGGQALYPTIEEKAAHLLYFFVKNHPFTDGNKRSGAFAFVWFLALAKRLDRDRLTPVALTALTILVAESAPKDKDRMIGLVLQLLGRT